MIRTAEIPVDDPVPGRKDFMQLTSTTLESLTIACAELAAEGVPGSAIVDIRAPILGQGRALKAEWTQEPKS